MKEDRSRRVCDQLFSFGGGWRIWILHAWVWARGGRGVDFFLLDGLETSMRVKVTREMGLLWRSRMLRDDFDNENSCKDGKGRSV